MALHVYPVDDFAEHELSESCWCGPRVEDEPDYSEPMIIHNLLQDTEPN